MSSCLEFTGKDIESAVKNACEKLNLPKEKLKHDVLSFGSTGVFGLVGTKKARIRVTLPDPVLETDSKKEVAEQLNNSSNEKTIQETESKEQEVNDDIENKSLSDDPKEIGRDVLQRIIDIITSDAKIVIEEDSNRIFFNIEGGNPALLIGKRGQTLRAIQYIVEKIINKLNKEKVRIEIDVEGYLKKKRANFDRRVKKG